MTEFLWWRDGIIYQIYPRFGTLADFDRLLSDAHRRGIHLILDLVLNHTSDLHPWFLESRSSRDNPKSDWYIWWPLTGSTRKIDRSKVELPNNWQSVPKDTLVYMRYTPDQSILVALNFKDRSASLQEIPDEKRNLLFSTARDAKDWPEVRPSPDGLQLSPYEVLILESANL